MKRRAILFSAALLGAAVTAAGLLATVKPFASAVAGTGQAQIQAEESGASLEQILSEVAPGSIVQPHADGSISVLGGGFDGLGSEAQAESSRMNELAEAGPNTIRCTGNGAAGALVCTPVPDLLVIPALKRGESNLYGRTVYGRITPASLGEPIFEKGELVCGGTASDGTLSCTAVDEVPPKIGADETEFVTYKLYDVSFGASGNPVGRIGEPEIPLTLASG